MNKPQMVEDKSEWVEDEEHYATLAVPLETALKYFSKEDVEWFADKETGREKDGRVHMEIPQIWKGELYSGTQPTAHGLLMYWDIDCDLLGEDNVEWLGWCDG
jgi:hypothetical protein